MIWPARPPANRSCSPPRPTASAGAYLRERVCRRAPCMPRKSKNVTPATCLLPPFHTTHPSSRPHELLPWAPAFPPPPLPAAPGPKVLVVGVWRGWARVLAPARAPAAQRCPRVVAGLLGRAVAGAPSGGRLPRRPCGRGAAVRNSVMACAWVRLRPCDGMHGHQLCALVRACACVWGGSTWLTPATVSYRRRRQGRARPPLWVLLLRGGAGPSPHPWPVPAAAGPNQGLL